jgi:aminomethyltransferase
MPGYRALHDGAAWFDLSSRGKIVVTGGDRQGYLHAMSSQAVQGLAPGEGTQAFFLDAQGRIQSDARLWVKADAVLLDTEPEPLQDLLKHLEKFIIMDDVQLEDRTGATTMIGIEGPRADEIGRRLFGELPAAENAHRVCHGVRVIRASVTGRPGIWLLADLDRKAELLGRLAQENVVEAGSDDVRTVRVENQTPRFGEDYQTSHLPHETQRLELLSFTKGCYIGQEIVERVRSRGQVNRLLVGIELDTEEPPDAGSAVFHGEKQVGEISSPVFSPALGRVLALAIVRREAAAPGTAIRVGDQSGRVRPGARSGNRG